MIDVLSLGAGVQSSTVLLMSCRGILPKLVAAIFADTQWEPREVYEHLEWLKGEAAKAGIPVIVGTRGNLRQDGIEFRRTGGKSSGEPGSKRHASIPLYVKDPNGGPNGKINRQCTREYKIEVVERIIRRDILGLQPGQLAPADSVRHWFGISSDEIYRRRTSPSHWQTFYYPLIDAIKSPKKDTLFGRGFDRQDCLDWLAKHYPGRRVPRSACIGCPFHSDAEWVRMRDQDPVSWADAVAFDKEIRAADAALQADGTHPRLAGRLVGLPFLHRSCVPLDQVRFKVDAPGDFGMGEECLGMCGV